MDKPSDNGCMVTVSTAEKNESPNVNNLLGRTGRDRDFLHIAEGGRSFRGTREHMYWDKSLKALVTRAPKPGKEPFAGYTSPLIKCKFPAIQFLPSWNVRYDKGTGFRVYLRVANGQGELSPWFFMGEGGEWRKQDDEITEDADWGKVRIDYLNLVQPVHAFQYRVTFIAMDDSEAKSPSELHRFYTHISGTATRNCKHVRDPDFKYVRVDIPYRSQLDVERKELRHIVCCPTCVAMVLESHGVDIPTLEVCDAAYCPRHKIHGIWPRAAQAAFEFGRKAWVQRFRHMNGVSACLLSGRPIIASIRVGEGELRGARYPKSNGHLIVITGLTEDGKVIVNDPYSAGPEGGEIFYEAEDIEKVWLDRGGVGIMVE